MQKRGGVPSGNFIRFKGSSFLNISTKFGEAAGAAKGQTLITL